MSQSSKTTTNPTKLNREGRADRPSLLARRRQDQFAGRTFFIFSLIPILLALIILIMLVVRSWPIFQAHSWWDMLTGQEWKPEEGLFGFLPFITGTVWVTTAGLILAVPPCLLTAIYLSEYAGNRLRAFMKPLLDLLAAIPPVVYGVWGIIAVVPLLQDWLVPFAKKYLQNVPLLNSQNPTGFSILAGAIVLAVMVAPFIISVIYEVMNNIPSGLKDASLALGTTRWQTIRWVVFPQALPGIIAAIVLGASRALGETIAVLMVVGNVAQVPHSLLDTAYPLPALIANNYGDMMSVPLYDSALLSVALILLVMILIFNIGSTLVLRRFVKDWV
ncbi:MAG: phosphate ABC transporter permease subunit PstC [Anaerolineales bacterium]